MDFRARKSSSQSQNPVNSAAFLNTIENKPHVKNQGSDKK